MANFEKIEFAFEETEGQFVNLWFWDWAHGRDVVGVVMDDGTVQVQTYDDEGQENGIKTITVLDFFRRIKNSIDSRDDEFKPKNQ